MKFKSATFHPVPWQSNHAPFTISALLDKYGQALYQLHTLNRHICSITKQITASLQEEML